MMMRALLASTGSEEGFSPLPTASILPLSMPYLSTNHSFNSSARWSSWMLCACVAPERVIKKLNIKNRIGMETRKYGQMEIVGEVVEELKREREINNS